MNCELGKHIVKAGWDNWRNPKNEKTARYAEYKNTGEGADISQRVSWARQLSDKDVKMLVKSEFYTSRIHGICTNRTIFTFLKSKFIHKKCVLKRYLQTNF